MVQFIPAKDDWAKAFRSIGSGVAEGYTNRSDENAIQKSISDLGSNPTARQILDAVTNSKTYSPKAKQQALSNYLGVEKFEELKAQHKSQREIGEARNAIASNKVDREKEKIDTERKSTKAIVNQLDLPPEQKEALGDTLSKESAESLLKDQLKPSKEDKLSPFEKRVQEKNADNYIKLIDDISSLEQKIGDIENVKNLSNTLSKKATIASNLGFNTSQAQELEGASFPLIDAIVKIFNPSGPIAQEKLKLISDKYTIKPSDAPWVREGKIKALERFTKQALDRANKKKQLIEKYNGNPPPFVLEDFDKVSDTISDAMLDYDLFGQEVEEKGMPNPVEFKGKTVTSPDGQKYHSDGTRWVKK